MANVALWVQLEVIDGKQPEVETLLRESLSDAIEENNTVSRYALKLGRTSYGIFDTFLTNKDREEHLTGKIARRLQDKASELFSKPPTIERMDILVSKFPGLKQY